MSEKTESAQVNQDTLPSEALAKAVKEKAAQKPSNPAKNKSKKPVKSGAWAHFKRWTARLIAAFIAFPIILYFGFLLAVQFLDFNQYKPYIEQKFQERTGYQLELAGNLDIGVLPFSVKAEDVTLKNPEGFSGPYLSKLASVKVELSVWDLFLERKLSVLGLELDQLDIQLLRMPSGKANWHGLKKLALAPKLQQLIALLPEASQWSIIPQAVASSTLRPISEYHWHLNSLVLRNASVQLSDKQNANHVHLSKIDLMAFDVQPERPFKMMGEAHFLQQERQLRWYTNGRTDVQMAQNLSTVSFANWTGFIKFFLPKEQNIPEFRVESEGKWLMFDVKKQAFDLKGARLQSLDSKLNLSLKGFWKNPGDHKITGQISTEQFNLQKWLKHIGMPLPNFVDQLALTNLNTSFDLHKDAAGFDIENLKLGLDKTEFTGQISQVKQAGEVPLYQFDLLAKNLNLDAYQAVASEKAKQASKADKTEKSEKPAENQAKSEAKDEVLSKTYLPLALPVNHLKEVQLNGHLRVEKLQAWNMQFDELDLNLEAAKGELVFAPLDARISGGELISKMKLTVSGDTPSYEWQGRVKNVSLQPFLTQGWDNEKLTGIYDGHFDFATQGVNAELFKQNLNGSFLAKLSKGAVKGVSLKKMFLGKKFSKKDRLPYDSLFLDGKITNGIYRIKALNIKAPEFTAVGAGKVDLVKATAKIHYHTRYKKPPKSLASIKGLEVPVKMSGKLTNPKWNVDLEKMLQKPKNREKLLNQLGAAIKEIDLQKLIQ